MKPYVSYFSFTLNIVLVLACVYMISHFNVFGKIYRHLGLDKWNKHREKIVMTGDRLIQSHWKEILKRNDILIVSNRSGDMEYINSQLNFILSVKPEICIITANAFDVYYSENSKEAFNRYRVFIDGIRQRNIIPIIQLSLVATPDKFEMSDFISRVKAFNSLLKEYCLTNHIKWLDVNPIITENYHYKAQYSYRKGVSLNQKGYEIWGNELLKVLEAV